MELNDKELLRLLKHGRAEELAELAEEMKPTYADSFPAFMDQMLKEHHLKRSTVARRSGLSQDYLYKLLRGDKRTTERDYIIAICMAAGLNIAKLSMHYASTACRYWIERIYVATSSM